MNEDFGTDKYVAVVQFRVLYLWLSM